jgi:hypothetical protein
MRLHSNIRVCFYLFLCSGGIQGRLPEPTPVELAAEAQREATMFSQAGQF